MHRQDESGTRRKRGGREARGEGHFKLRREGGSNRVPKSCQWAEDSRFSQRCRLGAVAQESPLCWGRALSSSGSMPLKSGLGHGRQADISLTVFPARVFSASQCETPQHRSV